MMQLRGMALLTLPVFVLLVALAIPAVGFAPAYSGVLAEPAPLALFIGFGDSALNFELRAWTNQSDRWVVIRSELSVAVYAALQAAGMEIPFPQREVRLRQG